MNLLEIKDLKVDYTTKSGVSGETKLVHAINGVNLEVKKGEILAIAGESGCGKSTLAKSIMRLVDIKGGEIDYRGDNISNLRSLKDIRHFYQKVQMIFQNPYSSLNPKMKIGAILKEPLIINKKLSSKEMNKIIEEKIGQVGLDKSVLDKYPHEFSGGQRQRIAIARSLILEPELIIADEPVSALDVSIQAQIINLLKDLKKNLDLTFVFISHDLSVIKYISDRVAIMYLGEIVEIGQTSEIFSSPKHPYTQALLSSVPQIGTDENKSAISLAGELPSPENLPPGCKFHTRCSHAVDVCKTTSPQEHEFTPSHKCKCFLYLNENSMI
ncbi:ABC transporter ATP-binding protein [bacterium]|nr:ABC transporter ATP-binding protein [bacterium]